MTDITLTHLIARQIIWSHRTFGPGPRTVGIARHIQSELNEIDNAKTDAEKQAEHVDVVILGIDAIWRSLVDWSTAYNAQRIAEETFQCIQEQAFIFSAEHPSDPLPHYQQVENLAEGFSVPPVAARTSIAAVTAVSLGVLIADNGWPCALQEIEKKMLINHQRKWPAPGGQDQPVMHVKETEASN